MTNKIVFAAFAATFLFAGCGRERMANYRRERSESHYQNAMADYVAGRLEAAEKGFLDAVKANPANASARFQLACLLQDRAGDYALAARHFGEYLLLDPSGDKAGLAKERIAICEKAVRKEMSDAVAGGPAAKELEETKKLLAAETAEKKSLVAQVASLNKSIASMQDENARLRRMIGLVGVDPAEKHGMEIEKPEKIDGAMRVLGTSFEAEDEDGDRIVIPANISEIAKDEPGDGPKVSPPPGEKRAAPERPEPSADEASKRPESYIVQEGDTLYRIAVKFYGDMAAWRKIRDANKATITTDGRIKAGQKIILP